ncbi:hypothetical protein RF11_12735 [Thelohanellus kitauei]|uniref:Uncharacterized protein n=1 Tax=Thelohanellus kitauei TaxID=669202 RepID=A0A0C2J683_THEKT|nr:hypothetical protein RF11_12735 [Thelohanellus kitauei]
MNRNRSANCKLTPEKFLQVTFHWAGQRGIKYSDLLLDVSKLIVIGWFDNCREARRRRNIAHFDNHQLGNGNGQIIKCQTPDIAIGKTLLKGKRSANVGVLLGADESIPPEQTANLEDKNENGQLDPSRSRGRRMGPWIFGLLKCHKQPDEHYKSGEVRLIAV